MNSIKFEVFEAIRKQLEITGDFQHIDLFADQYANPELHNVYPTPAAFIQFENIEKASERQMDLKKDYGLRKQAEITLHLEFTSFTDKIFSFKEIDNIITGADTIIRTLEGENFSKLLFEREQQPDNVNFRTIWMLTYSTSWTERTADRKHLKGAIKKVNINSTHE